MISTLEDLGVLREIFLIFCAAVLASAIYTYITSIVTTNLYKPIKGKGSRFNTDGIPYR